MKLSIATSVFLKVYLTEDAVDEIISAGYEGIDLWCGRPHLYRKDHPAALYKELRKKMQANGLKAVSVMPAFFRYPFSFIQPGGYNPV